MARFRGFVPVVATRLRVSSDTVPSTILPGMRSIVLSRPGPTHQHRKPTGNQLIGHRIEAADGGNRRSIRLAAVGVFWLVAMFLLGPGALFAQNVGQISGSVVDSS